MDIQKSDLLPIIRLIANRSKLVRFPNLRRPPIPYDKPATAGLVNWGIRVYCYCWLRHLSRLAAGILVLVDSGNAPSAIIVARSAFELGAHAYYVKKHLKQHLDLTDLNSAWEFLGPVRTGSRYMNTQFPHESSMFPESPHIRKVINCFAEIVPSANEDYSFMSEYCHPNMFAFSQYSSWASPYEIGFVDHEPGGWSGSTAANCILGLMQIEELLRLAGEESVRPVLVGLLKEITKLGEEQTQGSG